MTPNKSPRSGGWILLGLLGLPVALGAANVDSTITSVTVYSDQAVVTRRATVAVTAAGPGEAVFARLPASLEERSLQVSGTGSTSVIIEDVTAADTFVPYAPDARVKALDDELETIRRKRLALADGRAVLKEQGEALDRIEAAA